MIVRQGPARAALLSTLAAAVFSVSFASSSAAAAAVPPYEPDPNAAGTITFYDAAGAVKTSGAITDDPFATYAVGSAPLPGATSTKATLFGFLPKNGQPTGAFSGEVMSGPTTFPITTAPSPVKDSTNPAVRLVAGDINIGQLQADFPNTAPAGDPYQGLYQLRIKVAGATKYLASDLMISGSTWTQVYPAPAAAPTATTTSLAVTPAGSAPAGTTVTLTATVAPSAATGTVQFFDGSNPINAPVPVSGGTASTSTSALAQGTHSLTAAFTSANTANFSNSTSPATSYNITAPPTAPGAPTGVTATPVDSGATVSWTAPSNGGSAITKYTVTATPASGGTVSKDVTTGTSTTLSGLINGTQYAITVTATNAVGTSAASSPPVNVTPVAVPGQPTNVSATAGDTTATVSWAAPANTGGSAITKYTVTLTPSAGAVVSKDVTMGTSTTVGGLSNGTQYAVTVSATNAQGTGPASSPAVSVTPAGAPSAPGTPTATPGNGQATVSFPASAANGSPVTSYTVTSSQGQTAVGSGSPIVVTGLTNGSTYTFTVTATNAKGTSAASPPSNAVTPTAVVAKTDTTVTLNQQPPSVIYGGGLTLTGAVNGVSGPTSVVLRTYFDFGPTVDRTYNTLDGVFSLTFTPRRNAVYRLLYLGDATHNRSVSVTTRTVVRSAAYFGSITVVGHRITVAGRVAPVFAGQLVTLGEYRGSTFVTLIRVRVNSLGRFIVSTPVLSSGLHRIQVRPHATPYNAQGASVVRYVRIG